jgi:hypothetical protein
MAKLLLLLFTLTSAQLPSCGLLSSFSINFPGYFANSGGVGYTFPVNTFVASFEISGGSNNNDGLADIFDFYVLNSSQYTLQSIATHAPVIPCVSMCALNATCGSLPPTTFTTAEAQQHLFLVFICRNLNAPCDIWINVTIEGAGPDCSPGCPSYDLGDRKCNPQCYTAACQYDNGDCVFGQTCSGGCDISEYKNGVCNGPCDNAACNFDGGDCDAPCATGCSASLIGNGVCNSACNNAACSHDGGDCASSPPASSPSPATNSGGRGQVFY